MIFAATPGHRMADGAGFVADLLFLAVDDVGRIYRDHRRHLGAAVAFEDRRCRISS